MTSSNWQGSDREALGIRADDYTPAQTFTAGDRVELHPAHDLWMRGARFGTVRKAGSGIVWVEVDKRPKPLRWFHVESLRPVR